MLEEEDHMTRNAMPYWLTARVARQGLGFIGLTQEVLRVGLTNMAVHQLRSFWQFLFSLQNWIFFLMGGGGGGAMKIKILVELPFLLGVAG